VETQVRTPQLVFMQPQRLIVPLFQRPYIWNREQQWDPLWTDITRVAARLLDTRSRPQPHFLGAVVLQQVQNPVGSLQERVIIDGQQRLTTLQVLLDALQAEFVLVEANQAATRLETLIVNQEAFWEHPEDRFKVWPTNRDRPAFNEVMRAEPPVQYEALAEPRSRLVQAHKFFAESARSWLVENGEEEARLRAEALEQSVRDLLQLVVIELGSEENAQEIFETLNARGVQLTAADLIKNFIFQRLMESQAEVEEVYNSKWKDFETGFWETEILIGRVRYPRSAAFLNQWLVARTGEEILVREVFSRFKTYADFDSGISMLDLVGQVDRAAVLYRGLVERAASSSGSVDRVALFVYRTSVLESEVVKPLVLALVDPEEDLIAPDQLEKALAVVESWMVRRMLVRATTKSVSKIMADLILQLRKTDRSHAGDVLENFLSNQTGDAGYWPDDNEVRREVESLVAYRRLRGGRVRMILEAIEDHRRGWRGSSPGLGEERVPRGKLSVEHVMPRKWTRNWPGPTDEPGAADRDRIIHTLGNLTLLTHKLNAKVSNGPWLGTFSKRVGLEENDVLMLNRDLLARAQDSWNERKIRERTAELTETILSIWPVPEGHRSGATSTLRIKLNVELTDLLSAGLLEVGQTLYPRSARAQSTVATVLSDGSLDIKGKNYTSPSSAAAAITGRPTNGWWYFLSRKADRKSSLRNLRTMYTEELNGAVDDFDDDDDDETEDVEDE
jgi:Protein of unknown function DUF262/Protein of unknown function (DUF1524)/Restriction Enzyme Adenine Methylase Associated